MSAAATVTRFGMGRQLTALILLAHERAVRGAELVAGGHVRPLGGSLYLVDGSAGNVYVVDVTEGSCNCPDGRAPHDDAGRKFCKHYCAVLLATNGVGA